MKLLLPLFSLLFMLFSPLSAQSKFLTLEEAFILKAEVVGDKAVVTFDLADDIYVYQSRVALKVNPNNNVKLGEFVLPEGSEHDGDMVYHNGQTIDAVLEKTSDGTGMASFELVVDYQGCSEKGLCYEPSTKTFDLEVDLDALKKEASSAAITLGSVDEETQAASEKVSDDPIMALLSGGNLLYILVGFFIFGLLLSLTPCVFPMVPILSSVIISHGSDMTTKKAFFLSMVYVQAMAITYTIAGVVAGLSGAGVQAAFQTPWVIVTFSIVFVLLALSMFGLFEIQMPQALQSYLNKKTEGNGKGYTAIAIMGLLSALIVGPCVAAPLAAALGFISQTGDAFLGGMALYALSMGMGVPLLIVGTGAGKFMPRPGSWMDAVKSIFGVMMLAVAIWMLSRVLENSVIMFLWSALSMFVAVNIGAFEAKNEAYCNPCFAAQKSLGMMMFLFSVALFIGSITHASSMLNPLEKFMPSQVIVQSASAETLKENTFTKVHSIDELNAIIAKSKGKKIMLDFYADWCTSCKELEHLTFSDAAVKKALKDYVLVQADVTANTDAEKALSKQFGLFGPPALIFYDAAGKEVKKERVIGFLPADELVQKLETLEK